MPLKAGFEGHVELGVELAKLQQVLSSVLAQNEDLRRNDSLRDLRNVLDRVKSSLDNDNDIYIEKPSSSESKITSLRIVPTVRWYLLTWLIFFQLKDHVRHYSL